MPLKRPKCPKECQFCLRPMRPREGKKFCSDKCRMSWNNSPRAAGKLRKQIEGVILDVLRDRAARAEIENLVLDVLRARDVTFRHYGASVSGKGGE